MHENYIKAASPPQISHVHIAVLGVIVRSRNNLRDIRIGCVIDELPQSTCAYACGAVIAATYLIYGSSYLLLVKS